MSAHPFGRDPREKLPIEEGDGSPGLRIVAALLVIMILMSMAVAVWLAAGRPGWPQ